MSIQAQSVQRDKLYPNSKPLKCRQINVSHETLKGARQCIKAMVLNAHIGFICGVGNSVFNRALWSTLSPLKSVQTGGLRYAFVRKLC